MPNKKMKKTYEDLLEFFGLKVGDRIKTRNREETFVVKKEYLSVETGGFTNFLFLINNEYEIITPKKVGELKCMEEIKCEVCPLRMMNCGWKKGIDINTIWKETKELIKEDSILDQEIIDLIDKRLEKEIKQ